MNKWVRANCFVKLGLVTNLANSCNEKPKGLVSKETVLLRRWGVERNVWFIKKVDEVIWPP